MLRLLPPEKELVLVEWAEFWSSQGHPLSLSGLRAAAQAIGQLKKRPGKKWTRLFITRHPEQLRFGKPAPLDPQRAQSFNKPTVMKYFDLFMKVCSENGILLKNCWNMDEKGVQLGGGRKQGNRKVVVSVKSKNSYRAKSDALELITVIEGVSAEGECLKPTFIYPGKQHNAIWTSEVLEEDGGTFETTYSDKGWTDDDVGFEWFKDVLVEHLLESGGLGKGEPCLLILDGHGSHTTERIASYAFDNFPRLLHIIVLPAHCTHKLQPLDVGIFGPLNNAFRKITDKLIDQGTEVTKRNLIPRYL
ncbi:DDE-domain-containing protein, partial [Atractiella rhizophila]